MLNRRLVWSLYMGVLCLLLTKASPVSGYEASVAGRKVDLDVGMTVREVVETDRSSTHERTLERLRLGSTVDITDWLRFSTTTVAANGGPTMKASKSGVYGWSGVFQDLSTSVDFEEFFLDLRLDAVDLRVGKQRVAWGNLDRFSPLDLISPLSYTDPFLWEESERRIGVPAVSASYALPEQLAAFPESRVSLVWVPLYLPYRFSNAGCEVEDGRSVCNVERWFPPAAVPPSVFAIPGGILPLPGGMTNPPLQVPLGFSTHNASPGFRLENSSLGLRYTALLGDVDAGLYYFHGFDSQPAFLLTAAAYGQPDANPSNPIHVQDLHGATTLAPVFKHIDAGGADWAYSIDRFTLRAEGAYVAGRPFARDLRGLVSNPAALGPEIAAAIAALARGQGSAPVALPESFAVRDAVEWGAGADCLVDGWLLLLQVNQTDVLHNSTQLLIDNVETRLLATIRKSLWGDRILMQSLAGHSIESDYTYLRPRVGYRLTDHVTAEVGYLFVAGRASSVVGQYKNNDEAWIRLDVRL